MQIHRLSHFILLFTALIVAPVILSGCSESLNAAKTWKDAFPADPADPTANRPGKATVDRIDPPINTQAKTPTRPALATPAAPSVPQVTTTTTTVAVLLPLSGQHSALGNSMLQAAQMALFDARNDNFKIIPLDTQGTSQGTAAIMSDVIKARPQMVLGPVFAPAVRTAKTALSAAPNTRATPMIAFSTDWTLAGGNTYLMGFMPFAQINTIADYTAAQNIKNFGIIAPLNKYGDIAAQAFSRKVTNNGGRITRELRFVAGTTDLSDQIKAFAENPAPLDAVFIPVGGSLATTISSNLAYHGVTADKVQYLGTGLWDDTNIARERTLSGAIFAAPAPRARQDFENRYSALYGTSPIRIASVAYDATALAAVLAKQGGNAPYSTNALQNPNGFAGSDGAFRFTANNLVERNLAILKFTGGTITELAPAKSSFR